MRPTPHALVPAALPSTIGNLKALQILEAGDNALTGTCFCSTNSPLTLACTELPSTIGNLKALKMLVLQENVLEGEHLRSTNRASDPSRTRACSAAVHDRRASGAHVPQSQRQQNCRYVLVV